MIIFSTKKLKPFKKSIFKKLFKQIDDCLMGEPISVVLSDVYAGKMEGDIVVPSKLVFCKRYVNDTYVKRKKNDIDELYNALNLYHQNIKQSLEFHPMEIIRSNGKITIQVYNKMKKLPVHCTSKILVRYKRNTIIGESTELRKFPPILTLRLNLLLTNTEQPDSLPDLSALL